MVLKFKSFITEGGNLKVGDVSAEPMMLGTQHERSQRQGDIHDFLHSLNNAHIAETGHHLFGPKGEAINDRSAFAGSSKAFMDPSISDEEHNTHKKKVGDVDIMVPQQHSDSLANLLKPNQQFGNYTIVGTKKTGSQNLVLARHKDGQVQQFDMEPSQYEGNKPSEWNQFSHSSDWGDVKNGVKGAMHKLLLSAMTSANGRVGITRTKKGDTEGFMPSHRFSVDRGMREGYTQIGAENGKPIHRELKPEESQYTTDVPTIYSQMFNRTPSRQDVHEFGSYMGLTKHMKQYLSPEQRSRVIDKFVGNLHRQMIGSGQQEDIAVKNRALDHLRTNFPEHFTPEKEKEISGIQKDFYSKQNAKKPPAEEVVSKNLKEGYDEFNIAGAAGRFNGVTKEHQKLLDNLFSQKAHKHYVFVMGPSTAEQTTEKDPMTIQEKIDRLKKLYPEHADSFIAGDHHHTKNPAKALAWMWHRHKDDSPNINLTMVAGSGSAGVKNKSSAGGSSDNYKEILDKYNGTRFPLTINPDGSRRGGDHRMNYANYNVVENPRGETSGSAVRAAARALDHDNPEHVERFRNMLHSRTTPEDAQNLMRLIKSRSSGSLKENVTISGDGGIGGLGFNSGNPATNQTEIERYITVNTQNSDQVNKEVSGKLNTTQNPLSKMIGFKAYNPQKITREKSLTYWDHDENGNPLLIDAIKRRAK
jgi:hypothetical protein